MTLYILNSENTNLYKIGITGKHIDKRITSLQTGNPHKINLVWEYKTPYAKVIEGVVHRHYKFVKSMGEWLDFDNISIEEVKQRILKIEESVKLIKEHEKKSSN